MNDRLIDSYLNKVRENFPDVPTENVRLVTKGWDNDVLILAETYVFRFPKRAGYDECFKTELTLLSELAPTLPLRVPDYTFVPRDNSFGGYRIIPGNEMTPEVFAELSTDKKGRVAAQLGIFLSSLHATSTKIVCDSGLKIDRGGCRWNKPNVENLLETLEAAIFPRLEVAEVRWAQRQFQAYLNLSFDFENRLTHSDLTQDHIFIDPERGELSGIIDFADIDFADPAIDFAGFWNFGVDLPKMVLHHYSLDADPDLLERSKFPWLVHMLDNMLELEASGESIPVTFESSREKLRSVMRSGLEIRQPHP